MFGSQSSIVAVSFVALALSLVPSRAEASPAKHAGKVSRVARVVKVHACSKRPVEVVAGKESATFALAKCDGSASPEGVDEISLLARPSSVSRPKEPLSTLGKVHGPDLAPGIKRVDPRLVETLELVADHFRKAGEAEHIVLGQASAHASVSGRAAGRELDFRIQGVTGESVAAFCKTLPDADCSYTRRASVVRMEMHHGEEHTAAPTDVDPVTPAPPAAATTSTSRQEPRGKLSPLPAAEHPVSASAVKPAEPQRFL